MTLSYDKLKYYIYAFIGSSVFVFFTFYLRVWYIGAVYTALMITFMILQKRREIRNNTDNGGHVVISRRNIMIYAAISLVWTFLGGQGGHYYQSSDWDVKNAVYRDLITRNWPVVYPEQGKMLDYYIGHWMTPAFFTKAFSLAGIKGSALWVIGNQFLWLFTAAGVFIVMILALCIIKTNDPKKQLLIPLMMICFSGMDIIGALTDILFFHEVSFGTLQIEWWSGFLQYSGLTTCLFWVFNQTLIPWIVILCLFLEKTPKMYVFLGLCASLAGPIPFLCIFFYMLAYGIRRAVTLIRDEHNVKGLIFEFLYPVNIISVVPMLMVLKFFSSNASINSSGSEYGDVAFSFLWFKVNAIPDVVILRHILMFIFLEVMVFFILLYEKNGRNSLYWTTVVLLLVCPFISIGQQGDFVMRFSVPAIMVLFIMCAKGLLSDDNEELLSARIRKALIVVLIIGCFTPFTEVARGYLTMLGTGKADNVWDNQKTLEDLSDDANYMAYNYSEDAFLDWITGGNK
ncbi:MAG: hypothetical protein J6Z43_02915 [Clostridiales bacterium]|nr:hypothetical protein [Clostridiales bacterium]